jgi:hypothetical protein
MVGKLQGILSKTLTVEIGTCECYERLGIILEYDTRAGGCIIYTTPEIGSEKLCLFESAHAGSFRPLVTNIRLTYDGLTERLPLPPLKVPFLGVVEVRFRSQIL